MANNCLVKKFNRVVNNNNLIKIGILRVEYDKRDANDHFKGTAGKSVNIIGGTYNGESTIHFDQYGGLIINPSYFVKTADTCYLDFPKYDTVKLMGKISFNADELKYAEDLTELDLTYNNTITNSDALSSIFKQLRVLYLNGVTLDKPIDLTNLGIDGALELIDLNNLTDVTGTLNNIGLSTLNANSIVRFPNTKNVSFEVEAFVNNRRQSGVTSGEANNLKYIGKVNATIFGTIIDTKESYSLSWTSDSITFDGTTYDNNGNIVS